MRTSLFVENDDIKNAKKEAFEEIDRSIEEVISKRETEFRQRAREKGLNESEIDELIRKTREDSKQQQHMNFQKILNDLINNSDRSPSPKTK